MVFVITGICCAEVHRAVDEMDVIRFIAKWQLRANRQFTENTLQGNLLIKVLEGKVSQICHIAFSMMNWRNL